MNLPRLRALLGLLGLPGLALGSLGCEKQACFQWSAREGACPSADEALEFFQNPSCLNAIRSVDSAAKLDGDLCCYDVTAYDTGDETCEAPQPGNGSSGGFGKPVPVPIPPPLPGGSSGGSTGTSPMQGCSLCFDLLLDSRPPLPLCPLSQELADKLIACECAGPCSSACCGEEAFSSEQCARCKGENPLGCNAELNECVNDGNRK